jgi:hypothetical protein
MTKHVRVMSVLLYVCDVVHLVGCNKRKYRKVQSTLDVAQCLFTAVCGGVLKWR